MLSSKSLPIEMEGFKNSSIHRMTLKPSSLDSNEFLRNTHSNQIHSSRIVRNNSTATYNHNYNSSTTHFITNSSLVIKLLGKRSTDNFPNYYSNEIQQNNRSKNKPYENFERPQSINSIDRIDIDDKKLNNSKNFKTLPQNQSQTVQHPNLIESERTKYDNSPIDLNQNKESNVFGITNNTINRTKIDNSNRNNITNNKKDGEKNKKPIKSYDVYSPPAISRKNITICVILGFCVAVAVGINFINLNSDYEDLMDFYRGYMGRRLLIVEGRLTSKSHIQELKAKEQTKIELGPQVNFIRAVHWINNKLPIIYRFLTLSILPYLSYKLVFQLTFH